MKEQELLRSILAEVAKHLSMMRMPIVEPTVLQSGLVSNATLTEGVEIGSRKKALVVAQTRLDPIDWIAAIQYE